MKFNSEVNLTNVLVVLGLVGTLIGSYNLMTSRLTGLEVRAADEEKERKELKQDFTERLDRIEKKLDRVIEKK